MARHNIYATAVAPGDVIVAYTDGTFEARGHDGSRLGLERLRRLMEGPRPVEGWPRSISAAVDRYRVGRAEDDVLVASMTLMAQRPQATTQRAIPCAIDTTAQGGPRGCLRIALSEIHRLPIHQSGGFPAEKSHIPLHES